MGGGGGVGGRGEGGQQPGSTVCEMHSHIPEGFNPCLDHRFSYSHQKALPMTSFPLLHNAKVKQVECDH